MPETVWAGVRAAVFLVIAAGVTATADARQSQPPQPAPQQPQQPAQQAPPAPASAAAPGGELFSIGRIRKDLERPPAFTFSTQDPKLPVFRLRIEGYSFEMPSWQQSFVIPPSPVPQPLGGTDYDDMKRLITPPDLRAIQNRDAAGIVQASAETAVALALFKKVKEARANAAVARARAEVQQELKDLEAHNARVAAGLADGDLDWKDAAGKPKAAGGTIEDEEKKKQDEDKKKQAAAKPKKK